MRIARVIGIAASMNHQKPRRYWAKGCRKPLSRLEAGRDLESEDWPLWSAGKNPRGKEQSETLMPGAMHAGLQWSSSVFNYLQAGAGIIKLTVRKLRQGSDGWTNNSCSSHRQVLRLFLAFWRCFFVRDIGQWNRPHESIISRFGRLPLSPAAGIRLRCARVAAPDGPRQAADALPADEGPGYARHAADCR